MQQGGSTYKAKYNEQNKIGQGNFGSATIVSPVGQPSIYYVAKKIKMSSLSDKDLKSAQKEAQLLKDLKHPHIVQYIESLIDDDIFIIIMEYCEEGDLAHHVKRMRNKKEYFSEDLILNWFLQIAFALRYIHERKILHRDIKTSNIFLSSNGIVKIGDFGISKILEGTLENADTIVGTPYYMSPEVCENTPYSYKSDVWALGCVLYELCTQKHAFAANNLLGQVYKIVQEKQEAIPSVYSTDLRDLAVKLQIKDVRLRPDIKQITSTPFIKKVAEGFIARRGKLEDAIPIKKTDMHKDLIEDTGTYSNTDVTDNQRASDMLLTPAQRAQKRKEDQAEKRRQELMQASRKEHEFRISGGSSKQKKNESLAGNFGVTGMTKQEQTINLKTGAYTGFGAEKTLATNAQTNEYYDIRQSQNPDLQGSFGYENDATIQSLDMNTIQSQNFSQFQNPNNRPNKNQQQNFQNNEMTYNLNYEQTIMSQNVPTQQFDPTRFGQGGYNQGTYANTRNQSNLGEREVMGDTIASMDVTNFNNRTQQTNYTKKMGEREVMGDTIASMDYTQSENLGNTGYTQNLPTQNYARQNSYDNRPIASSGQYNYAKYLDDDEQVEKPDPKSFEKKPTRKRSEKGMNNTIKEDEMEEFPDDFEEYLSDGNFIFLIIQLKKIWTITKMIINVSLMSQMQMKWSKLWIFTRITLMNH